MTQSSDRLKKSATDKSFKGKPIRSKLGTDNVDSGDRPDSADSDSDRYLNLTEETIAGKTGSVDAETNTTVYSKSTDIGPNVRLRPDSPLSNLLRPLYLCESMSELPNAIESVRCNLSPLLSKLSALEDESKLWTVLQVKLAVLQEEKRQLTNILKQKRHLKRSLSSSMGVSNGSSPTHSERSSPTSAFSDSDDTRLGFSPPRQRRFQSYSLGISEETQTDDSFDESLDNIKFCPSCLNVRIKGEQMKRKEMVDKAVQKIIKTDSTHAATETVHRPVTDTGVGDDIAVKLFTNASTQQKVSQKDASLQAQPVLKAEKNFMTGCEISNMISVGVLSKTTTKDASFGDDVAEKYFCDKEVQEILEQHDKGVDFRPSMVDRNVNFGCGVSDLKSIGVGHSIETADAECGDGRAEVELESKGIQNFVEVKEIGLSPVNWETSDFTAYCNLDYKESRAIGVSEDTTTDILCDVCSNRKVTAVGVGSYDGHFKRGLCKTDDKLCECIKPLTDTIGIGDADVNIVICDQCTNKRTQSIGTGDCRTDDLLCDRCLTLQVKSVGCGESKINDILCDKCTNIRVRSIAVGRDTEMMDYVSVGVGDFSINVSGKSSETHQTGVISNGEDDERYRSFDENQNHIVCDQCGNAVRSTEIYMGHQDGDILTSEREGSSDSTDLEGGRPYSYHSEDETEPRYECVVPFRIKSIY